MTELRCPHKLHGELLEEDAVLEIKCRSQFCGAGPGVVVLHRFDLQSGKMVKTLRFQEPERRA